MLRISVCVEDQFAYIRTYVQYVCVEDLSMC